MELRIWAKSLLEVISSWPFIKNDLITLFMCVGGEVMPEESLQGFFLSITQVSESSLDSNRGDEAQQSAPFTHSAVFLDPGPFLCNILMFHK